MKCVIVEDEQASRETLKNYISKYCPNVVVVAEAENILEGYECIVREKPDCVFLDIEMPFGNAFDLLEKFSSINFEIIFITAFSEYAIKAINLSNCKYLLKPLNINELVDAVNFVTEQKALHKNQKTSSVLLENLAIENHQLKKLVLPTMDGFEVTVLKDIMYCVANDNLTDFYLSNQQKKVTCKTLKHYELTLQDYGFVRVHKSYLININYVTSFKKGKTGEIFIGNISIPLSPNRKDDFEKFFMR
jgi:two-component system LytT family response regulator